MKTCTNLCTNLAPVFDRTFQHYRAPIDGLVRVHPQPNKVKELAISLILISRLAEIELRACDVKDVEDVEGVKDTLSVYRDLIDRLYNMSVNAFYNHLSYEGLLTTVWETMIQSAISDCFMLNECEDLNFQQFLVVWKLYIQSRQNVIGMIHNWLINMIQ